MTIKTIINDDRVLWSKVSKNMLCEEEKQPLRIETQNQHWKLCSYYYVYGEGSSRLRQDTNFTRFWWLPKTLSNSKVLIAENVPTVHFHLWVDCLVNSCPILAHIFFSSKQGNNLFFFKITLQVSHGTNCLCWFSGLYFWTSWRRPKTNSNLLMSGFLLPE